MHSPNREKRESRSNKGKSFTGLSGPVLTPTCNQLSNPIPMRTQPAAHSMPCPSARTPAPATQPVLLAASPHPSQARPPMPNTDRPHVCIRLPSKASGSMIRLVNSVHVQLGPTRRHPTPPALNIPPSHNIIPSSDQAHNTHPPRNSESMAAPSHILKRASLTVILASPFSSQISAQAAGIIPPARPRPH